MADEVLELEERLTELVHEMREVCVLAARSPARRRADVERAARRLRDRAHGQRRGRHRHDRHAPSRHPRGARRRPRGRRGDVAPRARPGRLARSRNRSLDDVELPIEVGMRVVAIRRGQGVAHRSRRRRDAPARRRADPPRRAPKASASCASSRARPSGGRPRVEEDPAISDLDRAVDVLVEMKNVSEAAVGLAYSRAALQRPGSRGRGEQPRGPARRDARAARALGAARRGRDGRPVGAARPAAPRRRGRGDRRRRAADGVARRGGRGAAPGARGRARRHRRGDRAGTRSRAGSRARRRGGHVGTSSATTPGFHLLALHRNGRYFYRPRMGHKIEAGDEIVASGPWEGREDLAARPGSG